MRLSMSTVSLMRLCAKSSMHRTLTSPWEDLWETPYLRVYGGRARGPRGRRGAMRPSLMSSRVWEKTLPSASVSPGSDACCLRREPEIVSIGPFLELVEGNGGPPNVVSGSDR